MKALFFRKCLNSNEYEKLSTKYSEFGQELNYTIVKVVNFITREEYKKFTNNFLKDEPSIKIIKDELYMDDSDNVHCALFTYDNKEGFLVYPSGYDYARYVAKWTKS